MHESALALAPADETPAGEDLPPIGLSVERVAALLDCGTRFVWDLVRTGEVESFRLGRARRVTYTSVTDYVARLVAEERALRERVAAGIDRVAA